jgi:hypothetical protein
VVTESKIGAVPLVVKITRTNIRVEIVWKKCLYYGHSRGSVVHGLAFDRYSEQQMKSKRAQRHLHEVNFRRHAVASTLSCTC